MAIETESKKYGDVKDFSVPPWIMYPELEHQSAGWRMGYGEYYIVRWRNHYHALSAEVRREYKTKYAEPGDWEGYYSFIEESQRKKEEFERSKKAYENVTSGL